MLLTGASALSVDAPPYPPSFVTTSSSLSRGALGSVTPELLLLVGLAGPLGEADGAGAGDSGRSEIGAVPGLGDQAGDVLVGPDKASQQTDLLYHSLGKIPN